MKQPPHSHAATPALLSIRIRKMTTLAVLVALGVILSPILRVPGMAPMQHLINVICAVLLGPWYALACAVMIAVIRMFFMGINLLAVTGAIFGAVLSGLLYRASHRLLGAVLGEIVGTGILGAIASYPVMVLFYGSTDLTWLSYVPSFLAGTIIGGFAAFLLLSVLQRGGLLEKFQRALGPCPPSVQSSPQEKY